MVSALIFAGGIVIGFVLAFVFIGLMLKGANY